MADFMYKPSSRHNHVLAQEEQEGFSSLACSTFSSFSFYSSQSSRDNAEPQQHFCLIWTMCHITLYIAFTSNHACLFLWCTCRSEHLLFIVGQEKVGDILLLLQLSSFTCLQIERLCFNGCYEKLCHLEMIFKYKKNSYQSDLKCKLMQIQNSKYIWFCDKIK